MWRQRRLLRLLAVIPLVITALGAGTQPGNAATTTAVQANYDYDHPAAFASNAYSSPPRLAGLSATRGAGLHGISSSLSFLRAFVAAKAGDDALRTVTALTREQDAALAAAMRDPNKLRHIFGKPQHNLGPLTRELGGQEALMREAVLAVPRGTTGTFEVTKRIGTYDLTVRGRVVNGVPRMGTVFVP